MVKNLWSMEVTPPSILPRLDVYCNNHVFWYPREDKHNTVLGASWANVGLRMGKCNTVKMLFYMV